MGEGINRVTLLGNLGADPELRFTKGGSAILTIRICTTERYLKGNERKEHTEWHRVVMFGKRAEALSKYLHKGSQILVEGGLRTTSWQDDDGNKRYKTEVSADNIVFCGGKRDSSDRSGPAEPAGSAGPGQVFQEPQEDDIPF